MKALVFLFVFFLRFICAEAQNDFGSNLYATTNDGFSLQYLTAFGLGKTDGKVLVSGYTYRMVDAGSYWLKPCTFEIDDDTLANYTRYQDNVNAQCVMMSKSVIRKDSLIIIPSSATGSIELASTPYFINTLNIYSGEKSEYSFNIPHINRFSIRDHLLFKNKIYNFGDYSKDLNGQIRQVSAFTKIDSTYNEIARVEITGSHRGMSDTEFGSCLMDGESIVASSVFFDRNRPATLPQQSNFWIYRIDENGFIVDEYRESSDSTGAASKIFKTSEGGYLAFGSKKTNDLEGSFVQNVIAYKFDSLLNLQWTKRYGNLPTNFHITDGIKTADGNFVLAGNTSGIWIDEIAGYDALAWLMKLNENGDIIWERKYRATSDNIWTDSKLSSIIELDDGTLYGVGTSFIAFTNNSHFGFNAWILKTDSNGCITPDCISVGMQLDEIEEPFPYSFIAFPNPSSEFVCLKFSHHLTGKKSAQRLLIFQGG